MSFANASNSAVEAPRSDAMGEGALGLLEVENRLNRKNWRWLPGGLVNHRLTRTQARSRLSLGASEPPHTAVSASDKLAVFLFFPCPISMVGRGREYPNSARRLCAVLNLPATLLPRVLQSHTGASHG